MDALDKYLENYSDFMEKINSDTRHFFAAFPQGRINDAFPLPVSSASHTVMAVDGSQIDIDTHEIVLCYVINFGWVVLHYGTGDPPLMVSLPFLFYRDEDLY